jgi:hypothetical protein
MPTRSPPPSSDTCNPAFFVSSFCRDTAWATSNGTSLSPLAFALARLLAAHPLDVFVFGVIMVVTYLNTRSLTRLVVAHWITNAISFATK